MPVFDSGVFDSGVFDAQLTVHADLVPDARIIAPVHSDLAFDSLLGADLVHADLAFDARIFAEIDADLAFDYRIHVGIFVHNDVSFDYVTYELVSQSFAFDYQIIALVSVDLTVDYVLYIPPGVDLTFDAKLLANTVSTSLTADWRIRTSAAVSTTIDWATAGSTVVGSSLTIDYGVFVARRIVIRYDGTDITSHVRFSETQFTSLTNGSVGTATILVRDDDFSFSFTTGKVVELLIDGTAVWYGFAMKVSHEYPFEYEDLAVLSSLPRYQRIEASDINILFERRVVFNQSDPVNPLGPLFSADNTPDIDAISSLVAGWLDLSSDGIDTSSLVEHVGAINVDQPARPFGAAEKWFWAMQAIAQLPAAVFYINPDRKLVYTDVDTPSNAMVLSDQPNLVTNGVGYREASYGALGDKMTNDYFAWGAGQGSAHMVFDRVQDASSIATHGRWQDATLDFGIYKQATINRVADSVVNGSPTSHRGHKDDRTTFECTVFADGFRVADKVRVISNVFGLDDVIPIRQMKVTFPVPDAARYDLTLSHEIDAPWSFFDIVRFTPPGFGGGGGGGLPDITIGDGGGQSGVSCDVLDSFSRLIPRSFDEKSGFATSGGWGSGELLDWNFPSDPRAWVNGAGILELRPAEWVDVFEGAGGPYQIGVQTTLPVGVDPHNVVIKFRIARRERVYQTVSYLAVANGTEAHGAPVVWSHEQLATDWSALVNPGGLGTAAEIGAQVVVTPVQATFAAFARAPAPITKTLVLGSLPTDSSGQMLAYWNGGGWYPSNGGGIAFGIHTYANSGGFAYGEINPLSWSGGSDGTGLAYYGGIILREVLMIGPDTTDFIFDQKVSISFNVGGHVYTIDRSEGNVFGYTGDGISSPAFGITASRPGGGGFTTDGAKVIEPDLDYYIRFYRPNDACSFVKVWESWAPEPTNWSASAQDGTPTTPGGFDGCTGPVSDPANHTLTISGTIFDMQSYALEVTSIVACPSTGSVDVVTSVPVQNQPGPPGSTNSEIFEPIPATAGQHTVGPYVPGSLQLWVNGLIQRRGVDFEETDPTTGAFTLLFTPEASDKIIVRFIAA